jgi:hypothetical protein
MRICKIPSVAGHFIHGDEVSPNVPSHPIGLTAHFDIFPDRAVAAQDHVMDD